MPRIAVVGGGLGGLCFAQFLRLRAPQVATVIFERDLNGGEGQRRQGYGIGLTPSSVELLKPVGEKIPLVRAVLSEPRNEHSEFVMTRASGKRLMTMTNAKGRFVCRPGLRRGLLEGLDVRYGWRVTSYEDGTAGVFVQSKSAQKEGPFDLLVIADGANSALRLQRAGVTDKNALQYTDMGVTGIAGVLPFDSVPAPLQELTARGLARANGPGGTTLMALHMVESTGAHRLMWSMSYPGRMEEWQGRFSGAGEAVHDEFDYSGSTARAELRADCVTRLRRAGFAPFYAETVERTPVNELWGPRQTSSLRPEDVKAQAAAAAQRPPTRVHMLGDAAHATTTHMGMGFNTACLDAFDLATAVANTPDSRDWPVALKEYEVKMLKRGASVVQNSVRMTKSIHATGWRAAVRDNLMGAIGGVASIVAPLFRK